MNDKFFDKLHEECGVFGIFGSDDDDVVTDTYLALHALQHRGQESCGIAVNDSGVIHGFKDLGLVGDVFTPNVIERLGTGKMAMGHCRYGANGSQYRNNSQPLVVNHVKGGMAVAYNGNITNSAELREEMELVGGIFHTTCDAEVIAYAITRERLTAPSIQAAVSRAMNKMTGAYSLVVMSPKKLIAARDPFGFRPLCIGKRGNSTIIASESCAFDLLGAEFVRDVRPGEIITISKNGMESDTSHCQEKSALCIFEFIYFARPDSVIEGSSVHTARVRAGEFLAMSHPADADVVIGVPDSGLDAALGYANQSGIPYGVGLLKSRYIARTFIQPTQKERVDKVHIKLNTIAATVRGKRVVLVDDSIVRGTTSARIVSLLRDAGATEVHMRLSSPQFLHTCHFGTDIGSEDNLIAHNHTDEEVRKLIDVDSLGFLPLDALGKLANNSTCDFCKGCFTGEYPVPGPKRTLSSKFDRRINE